jgi:hypothetical protein
MRPQPLYSAGALLVMWNSSSTAVPVLLVTGPIGVGKTAVLHEADALLIEAAAGHATVELEEIAGCWTDAMESSRASLVYQNLAALWSNFAAAGASRLLLSGLLEQRSEVRRVSEAVPGAEVTVVRLYAPLRRRPQSRRGDRRRPPLGHQPWKRHPPGAQDGRAARLLTRERPRPAQATFPHTGPSDSARGGVAACISSHNCD